MIRLLPFDTADFDRFKSWIESPEQLMQFAGPYFTFPVTDEQLIKYVEDPNRQPYKIVRTDNGEVIGHCELNFERTVPRLSRILIASNTERNKGYGKKTVNALLKFMFVDSSYDSADLNVYAWNANAIRCYESVGFRINEGVQTEVLIGNEKWTVLNMCIRKTDWMVRTQ